MLPHCGTIKVADNRIKPMSSSVAQAIENRPQSFALGWDFILMTSNIKVFLDGLRNELLGSQANFEKETVIDSNSFGLVSLLPHIYIRDSYPMVL